MMTHYYAWRNSPDFGLCPCPKRRTLYRRRCRIVARGTMNSRLIEFEDGQREIVSGNAIRRIKETK